MIGATIHACAAAGSAFLVAVLWFDLMFDVQTCGRGGGDLPAEVLASIRGYYRRVTTEATPMNRLITAVMALTVISIVVEVVRGAAPWWVGLISLAAAVSAIGLAAIRTVPNAVRLGRELDPTDIQSRLARSIYRDHLFCLAAMGLVVGLQLTAGL